MKNMLSRYRLRNTLVAAGLALVGVLLVLLYVTSYRRDVQRGADLAQVFVAARDIPEGTSGAAVAGGGYLERRSVLRRSVVAGAISSPDQISSLAAASTIVAGEQVTVRQFRPAAQQGILASISGNERAMTVPGASNQILAGVVKDGDRVDVLANLRYGGLAGAGGARGGGGGVATRVVLRDLLVLRAPSGSDSSNGSAITLALTDTQAEKLLFVLRNGDWWLVLRPVARPADSPESVETLDSVLADGLGSTALRQLGGGYGNGGPAGGR
ncbi:MAG TPA: Flp pilus assembly protein CpaB [Gaiellaceae bacterium]|nr:Flp pilus assembly protein CpaB [Gaiellaceae bacterium]